MIMAKRRDYPASLLQNAPIVVNRGFGPHPTDDSSLATYRPPLLTDDPLRIVTGGRVVRLTPSSAASTQSPLRRSASKSACQLQRLFRPRARRIFAPCPPVLSLGGVILQQVKMSVRSVAGLSLQ